MRGMLYGEEGKEREEVEEEGLISGHEERCCVGVGGFPHHHNNNRLVVVGYALTSKKTKSFLQPKFEGLAR